MADVCSTAVFSACGLVDHEHDGFFTGTTSACLHVPWIVQHLSGHTFLPTIHLLSVRHPSISITHSHQDINFYAGSDLLTTRHTHVRNTHTEITAVPAT